VPRRVHDVDLDAAVAHGRVLRHDGDAALALQVHRVHHALAHVLVRAERARLPEHRVHQRRLAVIDVRDDRDVAYVLSLFSHDLIFAGFAVFDCSLRRRDRKPQPCARSASRQSETDNY